MLSFEKNPKLALYFALFIGFTSITYVVLPFSVVSMSVAITTLGMLFFFYLKIWSAYKSNIRDSNSWKKSVVSRITIEFIWSIMVALLMGSILLLVLMLSGGFVYKDARTVIVLLLCFIFWSAFVNFGGEFLHLFRQSKLLETKIKMHNKEQVKLQKETLQDLISPHFLFNSLNTIVSIISENEENSIKFVNELSELYNFMLINSQKESILIKNDLVLAKKYVYLLQTRHESSLKVYFYVGDEYLDCQIPPFTLQNLIENAVKHNSVSKKTALNIEVFVQEQFLVVKNNLNAKVNSAENSTSLGLNYIQTLLEQLTSEKIRIEKTEFDFIVKIPLIYVINQNTVESTHH